ncbi:MAG: hypothetical protein IJG36_00010 [Synergistaceae bacterium]|nr:hypothetical protein [Synergistaceae bacterium]
MKKILLAVTLALTLSAAPALCAGIQIPGYDVIHFKAGKIQQDVFFRNPENNPCCFRMSITLASGVPVWISDDVLYPGEVFTKIDLEREMKPGIYRNAVLKYECYSVEGLYKMNGAEIRVTLQFE